LVRLILLVSDFGGGEEGKGSGSGYSTANTTMFYNGWL